MAVEKGGLKGLPFFNSANMVKWSKAEMSLVRKKRNTLNDRQNLPPLTMPLLRFKEIIQISWQRGWNAGYMH